VPLDFLKRRGDGKVDAPAAHAAGLPDEVVAQEFQLKLYYAGKSSEGVRMRAGPNAMADLPSMLAGVTGSEIEVVEPLPIELSRVACAHCGFASAHERAFYCPKCGMRLLRG